MRVLLLYNPISGSGRSKELVRSLGDRLDTALPDLEHRPLATRPEPPRDWLEPELEGVDLLVVIGGDGAMRLAAEAAIRTRTPVYHYPAGTENLFARDHGMRADPDALIAAIRDGEHRTQDVARVGESLVLLCVSAGLDAEVVHDLDTHRRGAITHASYLRPILRQAVRWRLAPPVLEVLVDGVVLGTPASGVCLVANSPQYAARLDPASGADPGDGLLDVVQFPARTLTGLLLWALRFRRRSQFGMRNARRARGRRITVRCTPPARLQIDGDPAAEGEPLPEFEVRIEPDALRLLVPPVREQA